jgi:hypothetical protein
MKRKENAILKTTDQKVGGSSLSRVTENQRVTKFCNSYLFSHKQYTNYFHIPEFFKFLSLIRHKKF